MSLPLQTSMQNQPLIGGGQVLTSGTMFFVGSAAAGCSDDTSHGLDPLTPFRTLAFAITQCTANHGDTIFVMENHTEMVQTAAAVVFNVSGVHVIGLGVGRKRPVISYASSTLASITFTQPNVTIENCVFVLTGVTAVVAALQVSAADVVFLNCDFIVSDSLGAAVLAVQTATGAHRLRFTNCRFTGIAVAGTTAFIQLVGTPDGITIEDSSFIGQTTSGLLYNATANIATNLLVQRTYFRALASTPGIKLLSDVTGALRNVHISSASRSTWLDQGACAAIDCFGYDESQNDVQAIPIPAVGTSPGTGRSLTDELLGAAINYGRTNYLAVTADFSSATWNTVATHELFTVTGTVRVRILPVCTATPTSGGSPQISLGEEASSSAFIGNTDPLAILINYLWLSTSPEARQGYNQLVDQILINVDIGYEISAAALTGGSIVFGLWWEPLTAGATVVAGAGGPL